ncbi:hypothetical protein [Kutzneria albida]|uniref:Uncharacterized protein n=1 Tax=Kutzneria albida DSM 43870 TaxID=1449976 RepID=W5WMN8_9PSEU|nr:hypothetical protein [Kutzneria albida]AHI02041.1 hypothetical protein KALB_8684 [Kutzneria albida DSM 43870]
MLSRYYDMLGRARATQREISAVVDNALAAGIPSTVLRDVIECYSETVTGNPLRPSDVHAALLSDGERGILSAVARRG